jgi:hypothetical protein
VNQGPDRGLRGGDTRATTTTTPAAHPPLLPASTLLPDSEPV